MGERTKRIHLLVRVIIIIIVDCFVCLDRLNISLAIAAAGNEGIENRIYLQCEFKEE